MAKPGGTVDRGYDYKHRRLRLLWKIKVDAGQVSCAKCGKWIDPTPVMGRDGVLRASWHLGHDINRNHTGPEHARCNLLDGARRGYIAQQRSLAARAVTRRRW